MRHFDFLHKTSQFAPNHPLTELVYRAKRPYFVPVFRIRSPIGMLSRYGLLTIGCLLCLRAPAQSPKSGPANVIKINPLSLIVATFNVQAERRISTRFSAQIGLQLGRPKLGVFAENLPEPIQYSLLGLTPELRYYLSFQKRAVPRGPYLATFLRLQSVRMRYGILAYDPDEFEDLPVSVIAHKKAIAGGFLLGYQFIVKEHLGIDLFVGPRYGHAASRYEINCPTCDGDERMAAKPGMRFDGLDLRAGVAVGYAF